MRAARCNLDKAKQAADASVGDPDRRRMAIGVERTEGKGNTRFATMKLCKQLGGSVIARRR
jgi:hypothetical protein